MFGLSASHLLILGLVILLFGAKRLPELGASLGNGIRAFKSAVEGKDLQEITQSLPSQQSKLANDGSSGSNGANKA